MDRALSGDPLPAGPLGLQVRSGSVEPMHPSEEELVAYLTLRMQGPSYEALSGHLASCPECAGRARVLSAWETPFLDDITFTWQPASGPRLLSWEEK